MKSIEEIKEEVKVNYVFCNGNSAIVEDVITDRFYSEIAKRYALEVAKEALKNASENAKFVVDGDEEDYCISFSSCGEYSSSITISKQSILSETNIPELK